MTPAEADELGKRIINNWRGGPPLAEWREELAELDAGKAGTAYVRLRRTLEHAPSIARFIAEYKSLDTDDASTKDKCGWCANGWTETQRHLAHGHPYYGWQPCNRCNEGRANETSEAWTKSPIRQFISDAEADRLIAALKAPKETA